jgi:hypothetical protein
MTLCLLKVNNTCTVQTLIIINSKINIMSNQTFAKAELYESIKKLDINALRSFMYATTADIVESIAYWNKRRLMPGIQDDEKKLITLEINNLEVIMLARTQFTKDFYGIEEDVVSKGHMEMLAAGIMSTVPSGVAGLPMVDNAFLEKGNPDAKVINMTSKVIKKIKQAELQKRVQDMLVDAEKLLLPEEKKAKADEAFKLAKLHLGSGNYIPHKNGQKPDHWADTRIQNWIVKLTENILKNSPAPVTAVISATVTQPVINGAGITKDPIQTVAEPPVVAPGPDLVTAPVVDSTKGVTDNAPETTGTLPEVKLRKGEVTVSIDQWDKILKWIEGIGEKREDWYDDDMLDPEVRAKFNSLSFKAEDIDKMIKMLKEDYDIDAIESISEGTGKDDFENESDTLDDEIDCIDRFLAACHEIRGTGKETKCTDEMRSSLIGLIDTFMLTRDDEDYEESAKLINIMESQPWIIKTVKDFFPLISYPKLTMYSRKIPQSGTETVNLYDTICEEIRADRKVIDAEPVENKREIQITQFEDKWVNELRGHILAKTEYNGSATKSGDAKTVGKVTFYTKYHVYHFIDKVLAGNADTHPKNVEGTSAVTATEAAVIVPTVQEDVIPEVTAAHTSKDTVTEPVTKVLVASTLEEALLLLAKNAGVLEDALKLPVAEALKGKTVKDPWSSGTIVLDDAGYKRYIGRKFAEAKATIQAMRTTYPLDEMVILISMAIEEGITPEDFVKENITLLKKNDTEYLTITGSIGDVKQDTPIKSEADFLTWVKGMYELSDKLKASTESEVKTSIFKSWNDFETQLVKKVTDEKVSLNDLRKWARESIVDKLFSEENPSGKPAFTSERATVLDTYLESRTRKLYETPESIIERDNKIRDYVTEQLKVTESHFHSFVSAMRKYCTDNNLDYDLKYLRELIFELSKEHNKVMYDAYLPTHEKRVAEDAKTIIVEQNADSQLTSDTVKGMLIEAKDVTDATALADILRKHKDNPAAILEVAKCIICDKKQIKTLEKMTPAEVNTFITQILKETTVKPTTVPAPEKIIPDEPVKTVNDTFKSVDPGLTTVKPAVNDAFEQLKNAKDGVIFREALDAIATVNENSTELISRITDILKNATGIHTKKVATQPATETAKMVKKAFERVEKTRSMAGVMSEYELSVK